MSCYCGCGLPVWKRNLSARCYQRQRKAGTLPKDWTPYRAPAGWVPGTHPLVQRMLRLMVKQRVTVVELAEKAGLNRNTILGWYRTRFKGRKVCTPQVGQLEACYQALGYRLAVIAVDPDGRVGRPPQRIVE